MMSTCHLLYRSYRPFILIIVHFSTSPKLVYSEALEAYGGYRREEAIMLLRRFYLTENVHGECIYPDTNDDYALMLALTNIPNQLQLQGTNRKEVCRIILFQRSPYISNNASLTVLKTDIAPLPSANGLTNSSEQ